MFDLEDKHILEKVWQTARVILLVLDPDRRIVFFNAYLERLTGYRLDEVKGKDWLTTFLPECDHNKVVGVFDAAIQGTSTNGNVNTIVTRDGVELLIEWYDDTLKDDAGNIVGLLCVGQDITRYKRAEKALLDSEKKFRSLTDAAQDAVVMLGRDGMLVYWNPAAERIFGYTREEACGHDLHQLLVPSRYHNAVMKGLKAFWGTGSGALVGTTVEVQALHKNGHEFPVEVSLSSVKLQDQWHAIGVLRDISERRRMEEERNEYLERIQKTMIQTIQAISRTVEQRDPYTAGHQRRVAELAVAIGRHMGLNEERLEGLHFGAIIHDIGKIYIPAEILNRPGELSEAEYSMIKTHPEIGYEILKDVDFPWPVVDMVRMHHERLSGNGYPQGLQGESIILEARILAVADMVEAMVSHRPYRPGFGIDVALDEIQKQRGTELDPDVVDACIELFWKESFDWSSQWTGSKPGF